MRLNGDIKFFYSADTLGIPDAADIRIDGFELLRDPGFETEVLLMIGTDARAGDDDKLPHYTSTKRGWWGDALLGSNLGSKLWLLERSKLDDSTLTLAEQYTVDALNPLIEEEQASRIQSVATRADVSNQANFITRITRLDGKDVFFPYYVNWQYQIFGGI